MNRSTDRATKYAQDVVDGLYVVNDYVWASCKRHLEDLQRKDIIYDVAASDRAYTFFEKFLRLNGGQFEGKPFVLHPAQSFIVGSIFGWKKKTGFRRFRRAYVEIGKGNGKSPLAAGIGLYGLIADKEPRAEIYAAATKLDQAKILFRDAKAMVQLSPELHRILTVTGGDQKPNMAYIQTGSFFRPIASEDEGQSGPRPHMALCDEVHEHKNRTTMELLERGFKFRQQPLLFMITNSGFDKTTICWEEHDHAVKVALGILQDDDTFSYVCGMDEGDDPLVDESCWIKANPLLGTILTEDYIRGLVKQATEQPGKKNNIMRLHFCVWTDSASAWMPENLWRPCEVKNLQPDKTRPCYVGVDLSGKRDLTAIARVWKNDDGTFDAIVDLFTPEETMRDREKIDRVPYHDWARDGFIHAIPGRAINLKHIVPFLGTWSGETDFEKVAYDRWRIDLLKEELDSQGVEIPLEEFGQGFKSMAPAIEAIEEAIVNKKLRVRYNPVLRWNVACAVTIMDEAEGKKFAKNKSTGRIDGIVALTMAMALAVRQDSVNIEQFINNPVKA
jgi:phage terminase large subunit-like protein